MGRILFAGTAALLVALNPANCIETARIRLLLTLH